MAGGSGRIDWLAVAGLRKMTKPPRRSRVRAVTFSLTRAVPIFGYTVFHLALVQGAVPDGMP